MPEFSTYDPTTYFWLGGALRINDDGTSEFIPVKESVCFSTLEEDDMSFTNARPVIMPKIDKLFYNGTHTTIRWSDGTRTTVNAISEDAFNKEYGLAMCIARKYFEDNGYCETPRAAFLKAVKNANPPAPKKDQKKKNELSLFVDTPENIKQSIDRFNRMFCQEHTISNSNFVILDN